MLSRWRPSLVFSPIFYATLLTSVIGCVEAPESSEEENKTDQPQVDSPNDGKQPSLPSDQNQAPVANAHTYIASEDTPIHVELSGYDPDGDQLNFRVMSQPKYGELLGELPQLSYQPNNGFSGVDSFTFVANDGELDSAVASVQITVQPNPVVEVPTVKVFLMAGQSNMEGNNTRLESLTKLLCHGDDGLTYEGETCGSTSIPADIITEQFQAESTYILRNYNNPYSGDKTDVINSKVGQFLCKADVTNDASCNASFDLADRIFTTVSDYYHTASGYKYGYDTYKQMTTAVQLSQAHSDGHLGKHILDNRDDVNVLQYQGKLNGSTLSFSQRKGQLHPNFGSKSQTYGPELMFGHYMGDAINDDVLLLKVVQGGTDIRNDWKTPCSIRNTGNELTNEELAQESLYDALIEKATQIQNSETAAELFPEYQGKQIEIAGFVWFQGWNDGLNDLNRDNYETNMKCLVEDIRKDLNQPNLPIVIAQSHVGEPDNLVQVGQANTAEQTANVNLSITDDLSGYYHFDSAAQLVIGKRMAQAMLPLIQ